MMHACTVKRHHLYGYIDSQVCFHRWLFADLVKLCWCITGPVGSLGSTNQNQHGSRLIPMAVIIYSVDCVHLCYLLGAQHHCLCPNCRKNPLLACSLNPTISHSLSPSYPLIHNTHDIYSGCKKLSQKPEVNNAWQSQL